MQSYGSCALHTYLMRSIYLQSFMLIPLIVLELYPGQSSKCKNKQRAIIKQEGHDGPEVAHLYKGTRSGASLNPRAFIWTNLEDTH
jgi:hypothetical protein